MKKEALDLFTLNYKNEGIAKDLPKFVKQIEKKYAKKEEVTYIDYLPWAVVERLFRMQGGKIEVVNWNHRIEFKEMGFDPVTGELAELTSVATFMHIKGEWQGEELEEFYPIFDSSNSRVIKSPDAQQLNASRQRGSVRLIARLSGIGLWIFEQQDEVPEGGSDDAPQGQGNNDTPQVKDTIDYVKEITKVYKKKELETVLEYYKVKKLEELSEAQLAQILKRRKEELTGASTTKVNKKVEAQKEKDEAIDLILGGDEETPSIVEDTKKEKETIVEETTTPPSALDVAGGVISTPKEKETIVTPPTTPQVKEDYDSESEEFADRLLELKGFVPNHRDRIKAFIEEKGRQLLKDLTYSEMGEIIEILKKL